MTRRPNLLAGEDLPPAPRQKRSLDKLARLKTAGIGVFAEYGYEGASVGRIARRAHLAVGGFYQRFRSKRQLLLALMDDLLEYLGRLDLRPRAAPDIRTGVRDLLARAVSGDLRYLGACRAWQEAALSDSGLARKQEKIHDWTTARVTTALENLRQLPGARSGVDIPGLARVLDSLFWSLLAEAARLSKAELNRWIDSAAHLIYHAMFIDADDVRGRSRKHRA